MLFLLLLNSGQSEGRHIQAIDVALPILVVENSGDLD